MFAEEKSALGFGLCQIPALTLTGIYYSRFLIGSSIYQIGRYGLASADHPNSWLGIAWFF